MSDEITHRLSTEGVDPLALAGVNDGNLIELARQLGVRVSLRGDTLTLQGAHPAVERATQVAQALVDLARMGELLEAADVDRLVAQETEAAGAGAGGEVGMGVGGGSGTGPGARPAEPDYKIILPGLRRVIQAKSAGQRSYLEAIAQHDIVIAIGPAGTGKTYLAVAAAVDALSRKRVRRIVLARPAVEAGESLGFLPGDLHDKVDPYLRPLYDALEDMMPRDRVQKAIDSRIIEIAPLAYMRGRTLADAFVILDEAQNATGMQMKMFLTRLGVNSRAVITGDKTQIDLTNREDSGLLQVERILPGIEGIAFCYLAETDVVRHRLVRDIIRAYAEDAQG
ncbi:MAG TPA: PhoH family protein [Gemmatimonadales bacterium]|jgi:phosphate starvation-inducible PhoH-like protein|nr:PhoH family protein [Gemmatimonadales bacterium]